LARASLRKHWSENQIVEILAVIATFGFLNAGTRHYGHAARGRADGGCEQFLALRGWSAGKHARLS